MRKKYEIPKELRNKPQIKGIIIKLFTMSPKKPNSALRKVAKVRINIWRKKIGTFNKEVIAYIPKEKHTLTIHNTVLMIPYKTKDLPGVKYKILRNTLDCK